MRTKEYFLTIRNYAAVLVLIFIAAAVIGYFSAVQNPQLAQELAAESMAAFEFIFDLTPIQMFLFVFFNNSIKVFIVMMLGVFFGIAPVAFIFLNGYILGILFEVLPASFNEFFAAILPHGIIEIPAAIVGSAVGIALGVKLFRKIFKKQSHNMRHEAVNAIRFYILAILPLLLVAALIEVFITPLFII